MLPLKTIRFSFFRFSKFIPFNFRNIKQVKLVRLDYEVIFLFPLPPIFVVLSNTFLYSYIRWEVCRVFMHLFTYNFFLFKDMSFFFPKRILYMPERNHKDELVTLLCSFWYQPMRFGIRAQKSFSSVPVSSDVG